VGLRVFHWSARQLSELLGFQANGCQNSLSAGAHGPVLQFEHGTIVSAAAGGVNNDCKTVDYYWGNAGFFAVWSAGDE